MGVETELYTLLGDDSTAAFLKARCAREGVGLSHALQVHGRSCAYVCQHDENGDMLWGLNDMALLDRLTPAHVEDWLPRINRAGLCVADANLPQPALEALVENARVPILLDPVSCFKADRTRSVLAGWKPSSPTSGKPRTCPGSPIRRGPPNGSCGRASGASSSPWARRACILPTQTSRAACPLRACARPTAPARATRWSRASRGACWKACPRRTARRWAQQAVISHLIGQGGTLL